MTMSIKEIYHTFFSMDSDDWISYYESGDRIVVRFMYRSDEGHGHRTKSYANFELRGLVC